MPHPHCIHDSVASSGLKNSLAGEQINCCIQEDIPLHCATPLLFGSSQAESMVQGDRDVSRIGHKLCSHNTIFLGRRDSCSISHGGLQLCDSLYSLYSDLLHSISFISLAKNILCCQNTYRVAFGVFQWRRIRIGEHEANFIWDYSKTLFGERPSEYVLC